MRNSEARGVTTITNTNVSGAMEGIVAHVSRMDVFDSTVDSTTMRGIAVTEMSRGTVSGNQVFGAMGSGFYCGDMSRWEFSNNTGGSRRGLRWSLHRRLGSDDQLPRQRVEYRRLLLGRSRRDRDSDPVPPPRPLTVPQRHLMGDPLQGRRVCGGCPRARRPRLLVKL